jgi:hypothetical protein
MARRTMCSRRTVASVRASCCRRALCRCVKVCSSFYCCQCVYASLTFCFAGEQLVLKFVAPQKAVNDLQQHRCVVRYTDKKKIENNNTHIMLCQTKTKIRPPEIAPRWTYRWSHRRAASRANARPTATCSSAPPPSASRPRANWPSKAFGIFLYYYYYLHLRSSRASAYRVLVVIHLVRIVRHWLVMRRSKQPRLSRCKDERV